MNGWQRIGVVLSIVFGLPTFLIAYGENNSAYGYVYPSSATAAKKGQEFWDAIYRQAKLEQPDKFKNCITSTVKMTAPYSEFDKAYTVTCDKTMVSAVRNAVPFALIPVAFIWGLGWTAAWIRAGFRRPKP